jgi:ankyrin repeat protein
MKSFEDDVALLPGTRRVRRLGAFEARDASSVNVDAASHGGTEAASNGHDSLYHAAKRGDVDGIKALAELGNDVNATDNVRCRPTHARRSWRCCLVPSPTVGVCRPPRASQEGYSAIVLASRRGHTEAIKALAELGADVNATSNVRCRPTHARRSQRCCLVPSPTVGMCRPPRASQEGY